MIKRISIKNFKSIKELALDCVRVNVFIGEANTGKTNILESVGILSFQYAKIENLVRFEETSNLFWDDDISKPIEILYKFTQDSAQFPDTPEHLLNQKLRIFYEKDKYNFRSEGELKNSNFKAYYTQTSFSASAGPGGSPPDDSIVKFYEFKSYKTYPERKLEFLLPPNGRNLLIIILTNPNVKSYVKNLLDKYGFKILIDNERSKISVAKVDDFLLIKHPFSTLADTLQRMIFFVAAIESNKDSILIFDEPDVYTFPSYTTHLAEKIGMFKENNNQFFIATHNPYFLSSLIQKTPVNELAVFVTESKKYETKVHKLNNEQLSAVLDLDSSVFLNLRDLKQGERQDIS